MFHTPSTSNSLSWHFWEPLPQHHRVHYPGCSGQSFSSRPALGSGQGKPSDLLGGALPKGQLSEARDMTERAGWTRLEALELSSCWRATEARGQPPTSPRQEGLAQCVFHCSSKGATGFNWYRTNAINEFEMFCIRIL